MEKKREKQSQVGAPKISCSGIFGNTPQNYQRWSLVLSSGESDLVTSY